MEPINIKHLPIELYAFSGKMGSGKDFISHHYFATNLPPKPTLFLAFADHLKVDVASKHSLPLKTMYDEKTQETRMLLQRSGTELGRDVFGEYLWVNALGNWIKLFFEKGIEKLLY